MKFLSDILVKAGAIIEGTTYFGGNITAASGLTMSTSNQFYALASGYTNGIFVGWDVSAVYLGYQMGVLPVHIGTGGTGDVVLRNLGGFKIESFAGVGNRIVVADSNGVLTPQPFSAISNIYNSDGTLTSNRVVNAGGYSLTIQSSTSNTGAQFFKLQNSSSQLSLIAADDRSIYMPHVAAIGTTTANSQARLTVVGSSVYSKSIAIDSTWDYQTSWSMKNGVYSAEFNLGGATKSAAEGGPGSLQISTYNATTATFRYPVTFFASGNVGFAGGSGLVPTDNGSTVQITGSLRVSALAGTGTRIVVADNFGVVSTQTPSAAITSGLATDYDSSITGLRNGTNKVFGLSQNFIAGTTRVFVNGIRYTIGGSYDYTETGTNQITFTNAPDSGDLIVVDYIKA